MRARRTDATMASGAPARSAVPDPVNSWIAGSHICIEDVPPAVRVRLADLLRPFTVAPAFPPSEPLVRLRVVRRGPGHWVATGGDPGDVACGSIARLLAYLEWRAVTEAIRASTGYVAIHAAALTRARATVLLLAPSGTGKTTLTLGLMSRGWEPLTDDTALIDTASLRVAAFPRCFHIEAPSLGLLPRRPDLEWVAGLPGYARPLRWAQDDHQPTAIVLVQRNSAHPSMLFPLTRAEAASALLDASLRNSLSGSQLVRVAARLASGVARCCRVNNGSLAETLDLIETATSV